MPVAKKQKVDNPRSPIIFQSPGLKLDVRLVVLDQEFHVHSVLLKLHWAFFRKFLDSPDKIAPINGSASGFHYEWLTKVDDDGTWHLIAKGALKQSANVPKFKGEAETEIQAFEKLLCATYNRPFELKKAKELLKMTEIADYYCALPILSASLDRALVKSQFSREIRCHSVSLFPVAVKLRNTLLFRECLIWIVGPWRNPKFKQLLDPKLRQIARCVHGEISTQALSAYADITQSLRVKVASEAKGLETERRKAVSSIFKHEYGDPSFESLPRYMRLISDAGRDILPRGNLDNLLGNQLVLNHSAYRTGDGLCHDHFLCATIADEDLPWDLTETDW